MFLVIGTKVSWRRLFEHLLRTPCIELWELMDFCISNNCHPSAVLAGMLPLQVPVQCSAAIYNGTSSSPTQFLICSCIAFRSPLRVTLFLKLDEINNPSCSANIEDSRP